MLSNHNDIEIGDLVHWWTRYGDDIVKEAGTGLILNIEEYTYAFEKTHPARMHKNFDVYRFKFNDIMSINERDVEILKE